MEQEKANFEKKFCSAIQASLRDEAVHARLKGRVMDLLNSASSAPASSLANEPQASEFEYRLSQAVAESSQWSPPDEVILATQSRLSGQLQVDLHEERAVWAFNALTEEERSEYSPSSSKSRFLENWSQTFRSAVTERTAPAAVSQRVLARLIKDGMGQGVAGRGQVIAFPAKPIVRRALAAMATLAAGFTFLVVTLFTSADSALANSVRADHQQCCRAAMARVSDGKPISEMLESEFGPVPVAPLDSSWELKVSRVCRNSSGQAMIHLLYAKDFNGKTKRLSFHYLPNSTNSTTVQENREIRQLTQDDFPVLAWTEGKWTCTICSPDLDAASLKSAVRAL